MFTKSSRAWVRVLPADSGRGGLFQVLWLKYHVHLVGHLDDLPAHQAELLVVIQHGVHVLYPHGVHGPVKDDPLTLLCHAGGVLSECVG